MHMEPYDAIWLCLTILIFLLHGWFSAAMSAVQQLNSQINKLAEEQPHLDYYVKQKNRLKYIKAVEFAVFVAAAVFCLYVLAWKSSFVLNWISWLIYHQKSVLAYDLPVYLPAPLALLLALLTDGVGKGIGRKKAETVAQASVRYVKTIAWLLLPAYVVFAAAERLFGGKHRAEGTVTEEEIRQLVDAGNETGAIEEQQREMINNIFEFDDLPVSDVMTHRTEIVAVDIEMKINDVICLVRDENYSRMPVYQESVDNIVGVLNAKDLLGLVGCRDISGFHIRHFLREALFVPETAKCDDVLSEMLRKKMQMAIVVDEYGGTEGLVCMEDILEEIVGNIQDEYDEEEADLCRVTDSIYTIDGNADPDEILPQLGLSVPENVELDTMGGFLVELLGRIPEPQEKPSVEWNGVRFSVLLMEDNWIEKLKAEILPKAVQLCETEGGK